MDRICTFRLDDIVKDMNWDTFYAVKSVFDQYGIKPLIGVVPDNQDAALRKGQSRQDFWDIVRMLQQEGWTIAQHGYQHVYTSKSGGLLRLKDKSEFAGLALAQQQEKIRRGKEILQKEEIYVTIFMAPGHTFDRNTLKALRACGFEAVTDGYSFHSYVRQGILHIPSRSSKPQLKKGVDTICLHTNTMTEEEIRQLQEFVEKNRKSIQNFSEVQKLPAVRYGICVKAEEEKNLMLRRIKKFVSGNEVLHAYLVETADENKRKQQVRRVVGIPGLIVSLIRNTKHNS